ncbi:MAG: RluA family pseudouridine synthase, partial [Candidatus Cloacimonetes bacterium]|nr:RluA family pseudouridine synthase [Candidatus Cloacimonadota bacterium]
MICFKVDSEYDSYRIDKYLLEQNHSSLYSRSFIEKLINTEKVFINSAFCKKKCQKLKQDDVINVLIDPLTMPASELPQKEDINLDIVYEDKYLAIINKPAGMTVHPAKSNRTGTLVNALLFHFDELSQNDFQRPGIVHRLDKDTTGLVIVTKDNKTHFEMSQLFIERRIEKYYLCICLGVPDPLVGKIEMPIARHQTNRLKMAVHPEGKDALSYYKTLIDFEYFALLEMRIETGRTHQIRVHLEAKNHPV